MDTTRQFRIDNTVASAASLIESGHLPEADAVFDHLALEGIRLSEPNKQQLFDALCTQVPFNMATDAEVDAVDIARRLAEFGVMVFVFTDPFDWEEQTCMVTAIVDACIRNGLPNVEQSMIDDIDKDASEAFLVRMMPERVIWCENDSLSSGIVEYMSVSFYEDEGSRLVRDGSTRTLKNVRIKVFGSYDVEFGRGGCRIDDYYGRHGRYDISLTVGEPAKLVRRVRPRILAD